MFGPMRLSVVSTSLLVAAATVAACGGSTPPAEDPSSADSEAEPAAADAEPSDEGEKASEEKVAWADMNHDQRLEYMGTVVQPAMEKTFKEYDAEGFKEFSCKTCHGEDAEAVNFELPNGLFALPPSDPITAAKDYDEKMTTFMMEKVTPQMAELLGMEAGKEMTCMTCHEAE